MDTRFWGPSAWILLHTICYNYNPKNKIDRDNYTLFFENLKNVLPCIYCRASYTEYIEAIPVTNFLQDKNTLSKWIYLVHNKVNSKLRGQGLLNWKDPSFEEVFNKYRIITNELNQCKTREQSIMGWNFLYCVAFVYPENGAEVAQTAHYNGYIIFFNMLKDVLPEVGNYKSIYTEYINKNPILDVLKSRQDLVNWLFGLEHFLNNRQNIKCLEFHDLYNVIESYRAGCGGIKKDLKPTCRKLK